ncbi:MAG: transposase [Chloroflexi bacterium]|nr:transposase [Chloroflexota bacterium]
MERRRRRPQSRQTSAHAFAVAGITVERVLTDNALNYRRSRTFIDTADSLAIERLHTQPYRPQTNGKAEAFNKTTQREWAYRRPYASNGDRLAALQPFLDDYNYARPHTAIGNRPPASRL